MGTFQKTMTEGFSLDVRRLVSFAPISFHGVSRCFFFVLRAQSARVALGPCIEHRCIVTEFASSDSSVVSDDDYVLFMI